jgi:phospholipase C
VRHLKPDQWRWYSHDYVPTIWLIDPQVGLSLENVPAFFDRKDVFGHRSFLDRAAKGDLPAVSWIDPNFYGLTFGPAGSNDDHPPSDLRAGQKLVLQVVDAVMQSPAWKKTLLVITAASSTTSSRRRRSTTARRCGSTGRACRRS